MEYNNSNIDLVKSLIHFFKFSDSNKLVLFHLGEKTFEYVQDFDVLKSKLQKEYSTLSVLQQVTIKSQLVLIDCKSRGINNSVRIANYLAQHVGLLQLPLYVATPRIFICVVPRSGTIFKSARASSLDTSSRASSLDTLSKQYYTFLNPFFPDEYSGDFIGVAAPSEWTKENLFHSFLIERNPSY